jgi:hypothetical protein
VSAFNAYFKATSNSVAALVASLTSDVNSKLRDFKVVESDNLLKYFCNYSTSVFAAFVSAEKTRLNPNFSFFI